MTESEQRHNSDTYSSREVIDMLEKKNDKLLEMTSHVIGLATELNHSIKALDAAKQAYDSSMVHYIQKHRWKIAAICLVSAVIFAVIVAVLLDKQMQFSVEAGKGGIKLCKPPCS